MGGGGRQITVCPDATDGEALAAELKGKVAALAGQRLASERKHKWFDIAEPGHSGEAGVTGVGWGGMPRW